MTDETALAIPEAAAPLALFGTTDPVQVIRTASRVATALAEVVNERKLYAVINGKKFPTVEAWTLLGSMLGVFPVTEWSRPLLNEDGSVRGYEARVQAQTLGGKTVGAGEAMCVRGESKTWHQGAQEFAIRSMAQTRATSKALRGPLDFVFKLAGFQPTPAEEMVGSERGWGRDGAQTGEILPAQASQESQEALTDALQGPQSPVAVIEAPAPRLTQAPQPVAESKRRGRPLGSKNHAKAEAVGSVAAAAAPAFGDDDDIPPDGADGTEPGDKAQALRGRLHDLASRLRKYQYLEKSAALPSTALWEKEIERTLGIFVERKFGTDVALDDVGEAGLQEAISDLKGFLTKYETADQEGVAADAVPASSTPVGEREQPPPPDTTVVQLHKPLVRNPVTAPRRGGDASQVDPQAALERIRQRTQANPDREVLFAELVNRQIGLLAIKEGLHQLTGKDEARLRSAATAQIESQSRSGYAKPSVELTITELQDFIEVVKRLTPKS